MTPDDSEDLEALKVLWGWTKDTGYWRWLMEYLYRTAKTQDDFAEILALHRMNRRMQTRSAIGGIKETSENS